MQLTLKKEWGPPRDCSKAGAIALILWICDSLTEYKDCMKSCSCSFVLRGTTLQWEFCLSKDYRIWPCIQYPDTKIPVHRTLHRG